MQPDTLSPPSPHALHLQEETLWLANQPYQMIRELGRGKSAIS